MASGQVADDSRTVLKGGMIEQSQAADVLHLGIDVGGTDVKVGLVDASGRIVVAGRSATAGLRTPENVFRFAMQFATEALQKQGRTFDQLAAVGLAVPGVLDSREWVLREVVNLPGWLGVPLLSTLRGCSKKPSAVVNDANAAALAEHALRDLGDQSLALVTLGTGIGCGVVLRGQPYGGDHGCAGELGHIAVDFEPDALPCTCGSRGHLESYAGAAGVMQRLSNHASRSTIPVDSAYRPHAASPRELADAAEGGDKVAQEVIRETGCYVGRAVGLLGQTLDPAVVLLGGAMTFGGSGTATGQMFLRSVAESVRATTLVQVGANMSVEFASLGNDAGVLGAAMVARLADQQ